MPAKNSLKQYLEGGYYHLYNRGVEKRLIFQDKQDLGIFLSYLKEYLLYRDKSTLRQQLANPIISYREKDKIVKKLQLNNFYGELNLFAYCLMPNHFHFLVKQNNAEIIDSFMNSLCTRYTMFFNRKYHRVGSLYQGVYKAVLVKNEEQLLHLSRYIHKQAISYQRCHLQIIHPCSYPEYLGLRATTWIQPQEILAYFSKKNLHLSYEVFVKREYTPISITRLIIEEL